MLQWNYKDIVIKVKSYLKLPASKIEGSFAGDIVQAVAVEITRIYAYLNSIREQAFIDTAQGKYLDRLAFLFNIRRKESIKATGIVTFEGREGAVIPAGTVVAADYMSFLTLEEKTIEADGVEVKAEAVTGGNRGNLTAGSINRIVSEIAGVERVVNKENFSGGAREEDDTNLRSRVYFRIRKPLTSGNKYQYEEWALSFPGVGKAKVFPIWNGPGTVKVSILNEDYGKASLELIESFKNYLDPSGGIGDGVAPVGAVVTVTTAVEIGIRVKFNLSYKDNAVETDVNSAIERDIKSYLKSVGYSSRQVISYAQIGYIIMTASGVDDYGSLTVNDLTDNIRLQDEHIAVLREIVING